MRLLASTDLALRVLMLLAADPPGHQLSVEALSQELGGQSRHHLHKIVQELAALGVVRTTRGAAGGVRLAVAPETVRIGGLIQRLEEDQPVVECFRTDGGCCTLTAGCRLRGFLRQARESFYRSLDARTLAECLPGAEPIHA